MSAASEPRIVSLATLGEQLSMLRVCEPHGTSTVTSGMPNGEVYSPTV